MCGIFGYIGKRDAKDAVQTVLEGIKKLEYRGYDSAGVAAVGTKLNFVKRVGKVSNLEEAVRAQPFHAHLAIAHTRWATHGKPSEVNAHPHLDQRGPCAVVHNGIIENHAAIRQMLEEKGIVFRSETDTEVIPQLIGYFYEGDLLKAVQKALPMLEGAFSIAVIHENHPEELICAAHEAPLAIGLASEEMYLASDPQAFAAFTRRVIYLHGSEVARITRTQVEAYNALARPIVKEFTDLEHLVETSDKGVYAHYMLKEIFEQPQTVSHALLSRIGEGGGVHLEGLTLSEEQLRGVRRIVIVAAGTSYHAGLLGAQLFEEMAALPTQVEIASEFRYKSLFIEPGTLAIALSQSGETADTLVALRQLKAQGALCLGICNVFGSTLAREVESTLFLRAGPEIGVASTKAFTSQVVVLVLLALKLANDPSKGRKWMEQLKQLPGDIRAVLAQRERIAELAARYAQYEDFFFLGRRFGVPLALEGALKLTEIAYVNAKGYPAGELKHGPIALITPRCPTVAFCTDLGAPYSKLLSNLREVQARDGRILAIAAEGAPDIGQIADDLLWVPYRGDFLTGINATVASQLFAYYVAVARGTEIDQPRNLAKSVTVE